MVLDAALRSVTVSSLAVLIAGLVGLPLGVALARAPLPGRRLWVGLTRTGMAMPTVFIGLVCYGLLSRRGVLGPFELLYTPGAIVFGEVLLALPIIASGIHAALAGLDPRIRETAKTLGAGRLRVILTELSEARSAVVIAILLAFARCVTELGVAMMVGGNIKDRTRTLATATALQTGQGEFARGLAMGLILLVIALVFTGLVSMVGREREPAR